MVFASICHVRRGVSALLRTLCILAAVTGCGPADRKPAAAKKKSPSAAASVAANKVDDAARPASAKQLESPNPNSQPDTDDVETQAAGALPPARRLPPGFGPAQMPTGPRTFADLIASEQGASESPAAVTGSPARSGDAADLMIDDTKAAVGGIRKLGGKHLALYTDLLPDPDVDDLTAVFDVAVPLWCLYFDVPAERAANWHLTGFLMGEKNRFIAAGMLPADLPPFPNGYHRGKYLWVYEQKEAYYRRHLLLHEGTHAFMEEFLGSIGPPWYAEGMAELVGTHRWQDGQLTLAHVPQNKSETPGWGRIKIIQDEAAANRGLMPEAIMDFGPTAHRQLEPYGWCWGLAAFLDEHPRTQHAFRQLRGMVRDPQLTSWFQQQLQADWPNLNEEWQLFVMNLDYGYDVGRTAIVRTEARPLPQDGATATIVADRGWQATGFRLEGDTTYRLEASGRYQVGRSSGIWWCEPNGITLHYHQGRPLGLLLGAVRDDTRPLAGLTPLARPEVVGAEMRLRVRMPGTLYLRINESAARLSDNAGQLTVRITRDAP